jgi:hypothetical protein
MLLTQSQESEMQRVFPNGWEESDIPAFWRKEFQNEKEEMKDEQIRQDIQESEETELEKEII